MNFSNSLKEKAPDQASAGVDLSAAGSTGSSWGGLGLLMLRLWVGQEFLTAGLTKVKAGFAAPEWFAGLRFPPPLDLLPATVNWNAAGFGEVLLGLTIMAGLLTRLSAVGLLFITCVAVYTVHFDLGWLGWNQIETSEGLGFKVPLMLGLMLAALALQGGGRISADWLLRRRKSGAQSMALG